MRLNVARRILKRLGVMRNPTEPTYGWDGTFRGQAMNTNVCVYHIVVEFVDGEVVPLDGDVTIVK